MQRVSVGELGQGNRRHGLSTGIIAGMAAAQGGNCPLCLRPLPAVPVVDHDHALEALHGHLSGRGCPRCVRGLLCDHCNKMLGFARDDTQTLYRAIVYLMAWATKMRTR